MASGRDKDATRGQPAPSVSPEGILIDEWCASAVAALWADYVAARGAWGPPLMYYIPLSADDARLQGAYFRARAALAAWLIGCSERGEIELWARPGNRIEDARLIPPSAVRALTVDYKKRTAEGPPGEGLPRLYDVRVRQAAAVSASAQWAIATTRRLRDENKIPEGVKKAKLASLLASESEKAVKAGQLKRVLKASYLENVLSAWGVWPLSSLK